MGGVHGDEIFGERGKVTVLFVTESGRGRWWDLRLVPTSLVE